MSGLVVLLVIWVLLMIGQCKQYPDVMKRLGRGR